MKSLHSSRLLQSKRYEFCGNISANPCPFRKTAAALKILCSHNQETGINCEPVHVILSSPQGDAPMRPIQAYVPKERILPSREIVKEGHVPMGREGSNGHALSGVRVDGPSGRRFLRGLSLTAAMPLRVVEGASKFIEGASLYKTIQPPCGRGNAFPLWCLTAPPSPRGAVGLWVLSNGAMSLQESIERFILSPGWGGKGTRFVREQSDLRIV